MASKARELANLGNEYEGLYQVSADGRVFSLVSNKWLKPRNAGSGYQVVMLYHNKKGKNAYVHRLVAEAFIDRIDGKSCVNHKDGDKTNNCAENLEWVTHSENMHHASKNGLSVGSEKQKSAARKNGKIMRKLTDKQALQVRQMYRGGMIQREIADKFNMSQGQISAIVLGKVYKEAAA